jgi:hypothetical protein
VPPPLLAITSHVAQIMQHQPYECAMPMCQCNPTLIQILPCPLPAATSTVGDWTYTFYNTPLSWSDAEAACVTAGGHLASFTSQTTYETVMNTFSGYITPAVDGTTTVEDVSGLSSADLLSVKSQGSRLWSNHFGRWSLSLPMACHLHLTCNRAALAAPSAL